MEKIAFYNKKGGVGKTTSIINIAGELAYIGYKVLVIDTDGQANSTSQLLLENESFEKGKSLTLVDYLIGDVKFKDIIYPALIKTRENAFPKRKGIDVIPCDSRISFLNIDENKLKKLINDIEKPFATSKKNRYDVVLIDFSPYMGENTVSFFQVINHIMIPITPDCMAMDGMVELKNTLDKIRINGGNNIDILGIFMTDVHLNESYDKWIFNDTKEQLGNIMLNFPVRHNTFAKQSVHFGTPLCWLKKGHEVRKDYEKITSFIVTKLNLKKGR